MFKSLSALVLTFSAALIAAPESVSSTLDDCRIPADTQWLLHLDGSAFRESRIGDSYIDALRTAGAGGGNVALPIDPVLLFNGLQGLTLYGTEINFVSGGRAMEGGVAVIDGTSELVQIVRGIIAGIELETPDRVQLIEEENETIYHYCPVKRLDGMCKYLVCRE